MRTSRAPREETIGELVVRMASVREVDAFADHLIAHVAESGRDGSPHFAVTRRMSRPDVREAAVARWSRELDEPGWGRAWLLWGDEPRRVVGHLELRGGRIREEMHRAVLAMGIRRPFTGRGAGPRMLEISIRWARDEARLAWIDLGVFPDNLRARAVYARAGFVQVGYRKDAFRLDGGVSSDDVEMTLALATASARAPGAGPR